MGPHLGRPIRTSAQAWPGGLVTGAARGMGRARAVELARRAADLVLLDSLDGPGHGNSVIGRGIAFGVMETGAGFGYKIEWLAVRSQSAEAIAAALGLGRLSPVPWEDAVTAAYAGQWMLTPPINGWTLAASRRMPAPEDSRFGSWLAALSASLGQVQYFGSNRIVDYYAWGRASGGVVERAFGYCSERGDEALFQVGERTAEEQALGVGFLPDQGWPGWPEWPDEEWLESEGPWPDEETVLTLAGFWSVDPRSLEDAPIAGLPWITESHAEG